MPIYEYQCQACGHALEAMQKLSAEPLRDCPQCAQPKLQKQISAAGFQLKGSGWYATDFKGAKANKDGAKDKGEAKSETAGDAKPAACGTGCGCH